MSKYEEEYQVCECGHSKDNHINKHTGATDNCFYSYNCDCHDYSPLSRTRNKEWYMKMAELETGLLGSISAGYSPSPALLHSSNGCHIPGCEVCGGKGFCGIMSCDICYPNRLVDGWRDTVHTPLALTKQEALWASTVRQTGFDTWLNEKLLDPDFKKEYDKALKEIQDYDRRENAKRESDLEKKTPDAKPS